MLILCFFSLASLAQDVQHCERQSREMVKQISARLCDDILVVCCLTGIRSLPDIRFHVPRVQIVKKAKMVMKVSAAFGLAGRSKKNPFAVGEEDKKEDSVSQMMVFKKPVPPKLSRTRGGQNRKKAPRKSILETRSLAKKLAMESTKKQVMEGKLDIRRNECMHDLDNTVMDGIIKDLKENFDKKVNVSVVVLENLNFNETIAMTAMHLGTEKICNMTAALIYGKTHGNPAHIEQFTQSLMSFGSPTKCFDKDLGVLPERTWMLHSPAAPESFLNHVPEGLSEKIRLALKSCSAEQMWVLKAIAVVGGSDCPIFLLKELLEDVIINVENLESKLSELLCDLIALGIIEHTIVRAIKPLDVADDSSSSNNPAAALAAREKRKSDVGLKEDDVSYLTYNFINAHCQRFCYNNVGVDRRQELHRNIADWYEDKLGIEPSLSSTSKGPECLDAKLKNLSKRHACFLVHHRFMAGDSDASVAICELMRPMELQNYCGQFARRIMTKMPAEIPDAVYHRIYPCIPWRQGVYSIIRAIKKSKVDFGTVAVGKIVSKKIDLSQKAKAMKAKMMTSKMKREKESQGEGGHAIVRAPSPTNSRGKAITNSVLSSSWRDVKLVKKLSQKQAVKASKMQSVVRNSPESPSVCQKTMTPAATARADEDGPPKCKTIENPRRQSKLKEFSSAYGGKARTHSKVAGGRQMMESEILTDAASFRGITWSAIIQSTAQRMRATLNLRSSGILRQESVRTNTEKEKDEEFHRFWVPKFDLSKNLSTRRLSSLSSTVQMEEEKDTAVEIIQRKLFKYVNQEENESPPQM